MAIESGMSHTYLTRQERMAEWEALGQVWATSFTDCVRGNGITPELDIPGAKIYAWAIFKAWPKFTESPAYAAKRAPSCWLYGVVDTLTDAFRDWLRADKSKKYRLAETASEQEWLRDVCRLAVMRRIMEDKHAQRHEGAFQDSGVAEIMAVVVKGQQYLGDFIKGLEHERKGIKADIEKLVREHRDAAEIKAHVDATLEAFGERERDAIQAAYRNITQAILAARVETLPPLPPSPPELRVLSAPEETGE